MRALIADLAYGGRLLRRQPVFTITAALTLALGAGATTAIFSVVEAVLLRPLPYQDERRIVMVWETDPGGAYPIKAGTPANFLDWQAQNRSFEHLAGLAPLSATVTGAGDPFRAEGRRVTANLFAALGALPALGRAFTPGDEVPENGVAIISHALWRERFGSQPDALGRVIDINGRRTAIVGVMGADFRLPGRGHDLLVPLVFNTFERQARGSHWLSAVARLKPGVALAQAQSDLDVIARRLATVHPANAREGLLVSPIREEMGGTLRRPLLILMAAAGVLLAIACLNVASLMLARAGSRSSEMAIRLALGAAPSRLLRQLMTEGVLLTALAGIMALAVALAAIAALKQVLPGTFAELREVRMDGPVFAFALFVSGLAGLGASLAPALGVTRRRAGDSLRGGGRIEGARDGASVRRALVVLEVALAATLLVGAGLLGRSLASVMHVDPGFRMEGVLTFVTELPRTRYPDPSRWSPLLDRLMARLEALPGVSAAGAISWLPLTTGGNSNAIFAEGRPLPAPGEATFVLYRLVTPRYFTAMGIPLAAGRYLAEGDTSSSPRVVLVNETMAARFWPGESAIGRRVSFARAPRPEDWMTVVGVVGDTRQGSLVAPIDIEMFAPATQETSWFPPSHVAIRVAGDPLRVAGAVRQAVRDLDPLLPVAEMRPLARVVHESATEPRFHAVLVGAISGVALLLAGVGIYGLLAYLVTLRQREMAIRSALGARPSQILRMVMQEGVALALAGLLLGTAVAALVAPVVGSLLFGVTARDAASYAGGAVLAMLAAVLASALPAWRASRIAPAEALKS